MGIFGALALAFGLSVASEAQAVALNRCLKIVRDPQVNRETVVNTCQECLVAKIERRRPGSATDMPTMREYTIPGGTAQPLPFMGPGSTRLLGQLPCGQPSAPR